MDETHHLVLHSAFTAFCQNGMSTRTVASLWQVGSMLPLERMYNLLIFARQLGDEMVTVFVGVRPNCEAFVVHKRLLCAKSRYLGEKVKNINDDAGPMIRLPEVAAVTFELFLGWIYQDRIDCRAAGTSHYEISKNTIALYRFAYENDIVQLVDYMMDTIVQYFSKDETLMDFASIAETYEDTYGSLQLYMAQTLAYAVTCDSPESRFRADNIMTVLGKSLALGSKVLEIVKNSDGNVGRPEDLGKCYYHRHSFWNEPCPYVTVED